MPGSSGHAYLGTRGRAWPMLLLLAETMCVAGVSTAVALATTSPPATKPRSAAHHYACSGPNSAHVPCHFSTPSGNIRCLWTPAPNKVACELVATGRGYRLRPSGPAKAIRLTLSRRGDTLPTDQGLVLTQNLSCDDTRTTMTCNQDYDLGYFTITPHGSRSR